MTDNDAELAARLAHEAGVLLLELRESEGASLDHAQLGAAGDRAAHEFLVEELTAHRPDDAILSEEDADDHGRLHAERVWIIDPLDGTNEYADQRSDWAVHVALWQRDPQGGDLVDGAVAVPARSVTLSTKVPVSPVPARSAAHAAGGPLRIAVSRSRAPRIAEHAARVLPAELVRMGSAGYKVACVVMGEVDAYVHAGGQYEWDSAAPVAVARAAGMHVSRVDGSALRYNNADPYLPDLVVARSELAGALLAACAEPASDPVSAVPRSAR